MSHENEEVGYKKPPISTRWAQFNEEIDEDDPWQFKNVLAT